jgi:protein O-mannosyl-transferase
MTPRQPHPVLSPAQPSWRFDAGAALLLTIAIVAAYQQVWHAGFIWDDDAHVTRSGLRSLHGLWKIWFEPGATQQYYPLLSSAFWIEHRLWADSALGYHLVNVVQHAGAAFLLYLVLKRLAVPGALLGAALFAVHPVCVESVAWISEQKNTLSAVFYLSSALVYLRFDRERRPGGYTLATGLFVLALLSKTVTATLPAALLVVFWWKRGRLSLRTDVLPLVPWLALGAGAGAVTAWMERAHVGASSGATGLDDAGRLLVAGRAIGFYLGKLLWPVDLTFIYPRWSLNPRAVGQALFPAAALAGLAALWAARRRSRAPLAVALLYVGTLFPALGFINLFPFIYSFVADHFQYLAAALLLSGLAATVTLASRSLPLWAKSTGALAVVTLLSVLTWKQCRMYRDAETLWTATIARNPSCWMAYNNLAAEQLENGRITEAMALIRLGLDLAPRNVEAHVTLADALKAAGRWDEALAEYHRALEIEPHSVVAHVNLGATLLLLGRPNEAAAHFQAAVETKPDLASAHTNLGDAFLQVGRGDEAIEQYILALRYDPDDADAEANLGTALAQRGRPDEALSHFRRALEIRPGFALARIDLGNVLVQSGRFNEAISEYTRALENDPRSSAAHNNLGYALLQNGRPGDAAAHFRIALKLEPKNDGARRNLADALARLGLPGEP